ncbi:MAG: hypothetical protein WKG32_12595 [Gemmatimonadaceae bacterium]
MRPRSLRTLTAFALAATLAVTACGSLPLIGRPAREVWGFTVPWDARSTASAREHGAALDAIVTGWIALDSLTGAPLDVFRDTVAPASDTARRRMALVTSFAGDRFHASTVRGLAAAPAQLARVADEIGQRASVAGYRGLVLDFEGLAPSDAPALVAVSTAIRDAAHQRGIRPVAIAVPAGDTAAYPTARLAAAADLIVVLLYDEHWAGSRPGAIASPDWVRRQLGVRVAEVGASRLVAALPLFGYHWRRDSAGASAPSPSNSTPSQVGYAAQVVSYADALRLALEAGVQLQREPATGTLRATRPGEWELWVADAELLRALISDVERSGIRRFALWRLGLEDPAVWRAIR